ncbi:MAG: YihY/virulence factor BrkB family protein [Streptosporangiales bacterium]
MAVAVDKAKRLKGRGESWVRRARDRYEWFDHLLRAYQRFTDQRGNQLAGAVTYFGFLSFFPLLAVAFAILVYVVVVYPGARTHVEQAMQESFPGLIGSGKGQIDLSKTKGAGVGAGVIGFLGLIYSGTGWVDALRSALRSMWRQPEGKKPNIVLQKAWGLVILVIFGVALVASVSMSSLATSASRVVLQTVGLYGIPGVGIGLAVLAIAVAIAFDAVVFALLFGLLPGVRTPLPVLIRGSLFAAVGFEVLKLLGTDLIGRTTGNPVYGTFAIVVGMLVWINLVSRITILAAAWTATGTGVPSEESDDELVLPEPVAERLERLPLRSVRRPLDAEALLYAEQAWIADHLDGAGFPHDEANRLRAAYPERVTERLRESGHPPGGSTAKPGSLRDLTHQLRVARHARTFR